MTKKNKNNPNKWQGSGGDDGDGNPAEVPKVLSFGQQQDASSSPKVLSFGQQQDASSSPVLPKPILHQRDVSALTTFDDDILPPLPRPRPMHHRGVSVDLARRVASVPQREAELDLPPNPPRARDVRASVTGTEAANTT